MALSQEQIDALVAPLQGHFQRLEQDVIEKICTHIKGIGELTATDIHRLDELRRIGFNMDDIQRDIADTLKRSEKEIYSLFENAARMEYEDGKPLFDITGVKYRPFAENEKLQELVASIAKVTSDTFINISQTSGFGFMASGAIKTGGGWLPLAEYYQKNIDYAILQARTGITDFHSAMRGAIREMADSGLTHVDYDNVGKIINGRLVTQPYRRRLDSSVRQNLLEGLGKLSQEQAELIGQEIGADGFEISWHSGYRPTHTFGGQQFDLKEFRNWIQPLMQEFNCYHRSFPIVLGISKPTYSKEELDRMNAEEKVKRPYEGKEYDKYEAQQMQRRLETEIRKQKDRITALEQAGDLEAAKLAKIKLRTLNGKYKEFSKAMDIKPKPMRVRGTGKVGTLTQG